ncbi:cupredoxin domain-containing protein [Haloarcula amylolytica]|uniref:cupredoxin domain-containing protein n=1 Tax=Haloarcula amylolytica TaxID=396317 RepID=UPI001267836B|nr:hypothetical protein [Haloarcula amylolytica]
MDRRSLIKRLGCSITVAAVAGCSSDSGPEDPATSTTQSKPNTESSTTREPTATQTDSDPATEAQTAATQTPTPIPTAEGEYVGKNSYPWKQLNDRQKKTLPEIPTYGGGFLDARGEGTVEIVNGTGYGYMSKPAVWVDAGQTVKWVWPEGERHDLHDENGGRLSDAPSGIGDDTSYTYTFTEEEKLFYSCHTHTEGWVGSYGVVVAGEPDE